MKTLTQRASSLLNQMVESKLDKGSLDWHDAVPLCLWLIVDKLENIEIALTKDD